MQSRPRRPEGDVRRAEEDVPPLEEVKEGVEAVRGLLEDDLPLANGEPRAEYEPSPKRVRREKKKKKKRTMGKKKRPKCQ